MICSDYVLCCILLAYTHVQRLTFDIRVRKRYLNNAVCIDFLLKYQYGATNL